MNETAREDEISGSQADYYHVVEFLGFGAVWICRPMPTFGET
jgi:hypothetical protein